MKRIFAKMTALTLAVVLAACGATPSDSAESREEQKGAASVAEASSVETYAASSVLSVSSASDTEQSEENVQEGDVLVAYFSATGNTEEIALHLQDILGAELYEIVPEVPYTDEDLNYSNDSCRANQEQNDSAARPALAGTLQNPQDYDVVFLGYPIWWGQAPKVLYTFLESCDFGDATIVPFCTSGSSSIGSSAEGLQELTESARWLEGQRFSAGTGEEEIAQWVDSLGLSF